MALLSTTDLRVTYGGLRALDDVTISVERGQVVGLIGPNGAGKTTFIDALTGFASATGGIRFADQDITKLSPHQRARLGLGRTWQSLELFDDLNVIENLQVAADRQSARSVALDLIRPRRPRDTSAVERALVTLGLEELRTRTPAELSQGQRKLVGVARALAAEPKLVCMDEPAAGLDTAESQALGGRLRGVVDHGVTVLLVDHDMSLVLAVCDYLYVIEFGRLIAQGTPAEIRANDLVIAAYLGAQANTDAPPEVSA
jgi:ABC-type branched-chain amino acid transport systems, ATPase component